MKEITYDEIRQAMNGENYHMELAGNDICVVCDAVNQGIDSRLEACSIRGKDTYDWAQYGKLVCDVSPDSLPVLLRRLAESGKDEAVMLVSCILDTLGIENENHCFIILSPVDVLT